MRREVPGNAQEGQRIGPVGGDVEVEHDIGELDQLGEVGAEPGLPIEDQDPGVIVTQAEFCLGADHPIGDHSPDLPLGDLQSPGEDGAGVGHSHTSALFEVPGPADDLGRARAHVDLAYPDLVGIWVRSDLGDFADHYVGPHCFESLHILDDVTEHGQRPSELVGIGGGQVDELLQPAQRELHANCPRKRTSLSMK
jgi:hypothetical protein